MVKVGSLRLATEPGRGESHSTGRSPKVTAGSAELGLGLSGSRAASREKRPRPPKAARRQASSSNALEREK